MKPFNGPRHQGGWIALAAVVVGGVLSSASEQDAADDKAKKDYKTERDLSNLSFEQKKWLSEQDHKWTLEDYQRAQNYKEEAIGGFRQYAGPNAASPTGEWQAPPARTDVSADTEGLAQVDENGQPYLIDPRTGKPVFGAPAKPGTLPQVAT